MKPANSLLPIIFFGAFLFIIVNTVLTVLNLQTILSSEREVDQTNRYIMKLEEGMADMLNAETGGRGYLLTGNTIFLETYNDALPRIKNHIQELRQISNAQSLKKETDKLQERINARIATLNQSLENRRRGVPVTEEHLLTGQRQMNEIRRIVQSLEDRLRNQSLTRRTKTNRSVITMYLGIISLSAINMFLSAIGYYLINRDLRKRVKSEEKKNEFISVASHELKTPLTSIKAFTQLLARYYKDTPDQKAQEYLKRMEGQLNRLSTLVEDLLDVTKIQAGKMVFNEDVFDIDELIDEIMADMQPVAHGHTLTRKGSANKRVYADRYRLGQVLTNLITNAVKYSPGKDRIYIFADSDEEGVKIGVQDFGIGVPKEKQKLLFDRFYRIDDDDRHSFPGLGLGLYISAQIMKRHHGKIWVESEEGHGSTFFLSLPITLHSRILGGLRLGKK